MEESRPKVCVMPEVGLVVSFLQVADVVLMIYPEMKKRFWGRVSDYP